MELKNQWVSSQIAAVANNATPNSPSERQSFAGAINNKTGVAQGVSDFGIDSSLLLTSE